MKKLLNTTAEVLIEKASKDKIKGRTRNWNKVICQADNSIIVSLQQVHLKEYNHQTFIGEVVKPSA